MKNNICLFLLVFISVFLIGAPVYSQSTKKKAAEKLIQIFTKKGKKTPKVKTKSAPKSGTPKSKKGGTKKNTKKSTGNKKVDLATGKKSTAPVRQPGGITNTSSFEKDGRQRRTQQRKGAMTGGGRKAKNNSANEKHGDGGRAVSKSEKQIKDLESQLNGVSEKERIKIRKKIRNIKKNAQQKKKGEEHSRRKKGY